MESHVVLARELLSSESSPSVAGDAHAIRERRRSPDPVQLVVTGERLLQELESQLVRWFGPDGVDALLLRALDRVRESHPIMASARREGPSALRLTGILEHAASRHPRGGAAGADEVTEAIVGLIATILALISRLVGDDMTLLLATQIWPERSAAGESLQDADPNTNAKVRK